MDILILVPLGIIIGLISSFFGIGGGAIIAPVLYYTYPYLEATTVIGTAQGVILLNSIVNTYYYKKGKIHFHKKIFLPIILTVTFGVLTGTQIAVNVGSAWLKTFFAIILFLFAVQTVFWIPKVSRISDYSNPNTPNTFVGLIVGFFVGIIASTTGLGGGIILNPLFAALYKMPLRLISAYNNLILIVTSLSATLSYMLTPKANLANFNLARFQVGSTNWLIIFAIFSGSLLSVRLGISLNNTVDDKLRRVLFAILLLFLSANMVLAEGARP